MVDAARNLPVIIAGAGPAGASTAIALERAGTAALVYEARGVVATRARNIFLRPQARAIMRDLVGVDPGRDTTIRSIENTLRATARDEGVAIAYNHRILDVADLGDQVAVTVQHGREGPIQTIRGSQLVDATGGRLPATNVAELERVPVGRHHTYVTAQYDTPVDFGGVRGAFDRSRNEAFLQYPVSNGRGSIAYYDLPPGVAFDEATALAKYDHIARQLDLGTPTAPPQAFDAQQHLSRNAVHGRIVKVGDSAGNADPYIGAGVAAALVDGTSAARLLSRQDEFSSLARAASDDVLAGHRSLARQAELMIRLRERAFSVLPKVSFDEPISAADLRRSRTIDALAGTITYLPIRTHA